MDKNIKSVDLDGDIVYYKNKQTELKPQESKELPLVAEPIMLEKTIDNTVQPLAEANKDKSKKSKK